MKSKTSFFNGAVLKKDFTRFAAAWLLYALGLGIVLLPTVYHQYDPAVMAYEMGTLLKAMSILNAGFGGLCALLLFGDLFVPRLCYSLHAMPLRREGWFLTHCTAGFLFSFLPNLLMALLCVPKLDRTWPAAFLWLGGMELQFLFFFGLGVLCTMAAGNRIGMILNYGICNFFSLILAAGITCLYSPALYGITISLDAFLPFSPLAYLVSRDWTPLSLTKPQLFLQGGWWYMTLLGALGLIFLALSLLIYRRRKLESAGDLLALRPLRPIFILIYTLSAGVLLQGFEALFFNEEGLGIVFLVLGLAIGFFTGQMLLRRTMRVFRLADFGLCAGLIVLVLGSIGLVKLDPMGLVRYVPRDDQVASVSYTGEYIGFTQQGRAYTTDDPEEIDQVLAYHRACIDARDESASGMFHIRYTLKSGRTVERSYTICPSDEEALKLRGALLSKPEYVMGYTDFMSYIKLAVSVQISYNDTIDLGHWDEVRGLLEAMRQDCLDGYLTAPCDAFEIPNPYANYVHQTAPVFVQLYTSTRWEDFTSQEIEICAHCTHTLDYLESLGFSREQVFY